jgi:hypothetical protein
MNETAVRRHPIRTTPIAVPEVRLLSNVWRTSTSFVEIVPVDNGAEQARRDPVVPPSRCNAARHRM